MTPMAVSGILSVVGVERNQALELCGSTLVIVHSTLPPTDVEWREAMEYAYSIVGAVRGQLVVSAGGGPTPRQRQALHELFAKRVDGTPPTAVVTSSAVARGIVTAFSWVVKDRIRAFPEKQLAEACAFVGAGAEVEAIRATVERLQRMLSPGMPVSPTASTSHR